MRVGACTRVCVIVQRACGGVMRVHVFVDNARIRTRVNAEKHNNPTGLATSFEMPKRKVSRRKVLPGKISCEEMISFQSTPALRDDMSSSKCWLSC